MPRLRSGAGHKIEAAIQELAARDARGVTLEADAIDGRVRVTVGSHTWTAVVSTRDSVSLLDAEALTSTTARSSAIVVANQITTEAKDHFQRRNADQPDATWSWLDRRGELFLNHGDATAVVHFATTGRSDGVTLPMAWRLASPRSDGPIRGRAGISYASALLLDPERRPSIRAVAHEAQMSHGAIGEAAKLLREAGLVRANGEPQLPDLFWALSDAWGPTRVVPVATRPTRTQAYELGGNTDRLDEPGWALGGDEAAVEWGAPVFSVNATPLIWVPHEADARRAEHVFGATERDYAAVIAVPPTPFVCARRVVPPTRPKAAFLPTAHPLFLALELARDPARGEEALRQWQPDQLEIRRVW